MKAKVDVGGQEDNALLARLGPGGVAPTHTAADALANATTEADYQDTVIRLLREQHAVDTARIQIPGKPGFVGKLVQRLRALCWKVFRYQHEQVTMQHNAVHALHAGVMEYEHALNKQRLAALEKRITELEARVNTAPPAS